MTQDNHSQPDDENELVKRAIKGDSGAFGNLYTQYLDPIYRYIYFRVNSEAEAEDLTEEVFIKAWEALPGYEIREYPFKSWLYRIAHNLVVDFHRKRKTVPLPDFDIPETYSTHFEPESMLSSKQDGRALAAAIKQLNADEQAVILLRFVDDLSHHEVAGIIEKSEEASRVIQHRALAKLARILKKK